MRRLLTILVAVWVVGSIILAACGTPVPAVPPPPVVSGGNGGNGGDVDLPDVDLPDVDVPAVGQGADGDGDILICLVASETGINDKALNASAWAGMQRAESQFSISVAFLESQQPSDYQTHINSFLQRGCSLIFTMAFPMSDATASAAEANPNQYFAIIDFNYNPGFNNVRGSIFAMDQAGFLAGYAAAAATQTGTVATFGGANIPSITPYMDGFVYGVRYYNQQNDTDVQVLGWDPEAQEGTFTDNFENFEDGRAMGMSLMDQGADVIFPVAGALGEGTADAIQERGNAWLIGLDTDWTKTYPEYMDIILTSVLKKPDAITFALSEEVVNGTFTGGLFTGTLENGAVGIVPLTNFDGDISAELNVVSAGIIAGDIQTGP